MATLKTSVTNNWANHTETTTPQTLNNTGFWTKYLEFADNQRSNRTLWFFISLMVHATVFLPLPILLVGYFDAPVGLIAITMICFFTNFVANMGGSGIRTTLTCFLASSVIHLMMASLVITL